MDALWNDLRFALRSLRTSPAFTAVAVATLALGIGANTAIFTVVKTVLLDPLPYPEAERLALILESNPDAGFPEFSVSPPNFVDFHDQNHSFAAMAAYTGASMAITGDGQPERLNARRVTGEYFTVLGIDALVGRVLGPEDDRPDAPRVTALGEGLWRRRFGADPAIVGRTIRLDGEPVEVVGVISERLQPKRDLFVPLALDFAEEHRGSHWLAIYGRLAPGTTLASAREDLKAVAARLEKDYPDSNTGWTVVVDPLRDRIVEDIEPALLVLSLAVGLVLLIACANIANLTLSRLALREREVALRTALGAGRGELVRQMLVESTLVALAGGVLGFLLALRGTTALVALAADDIPRSEAVAVDGGVLLFTLALSLLTGVLFGLVPALRASRPDLQSALKEGGRGAAGASGQRLRTGLVLAEVAVAVLLLVGAGLLIRSFASLLAVDPGFDTRSALTVQLRLPDAKYPDDPARVAFFRQLFERTAALPGVAGMGAAAPMPLTGSGFVLQFFVEGRERPPLNQEPHSNIRAVSPGFFETMGIPLIRGRTIGWQDDAESERVVVINRSAARRYWPGQDPLGQRITFDEPDDEDVTWYRVVGLVGDVHHESLAAETEPEMVWSYLQNPLRGTTLILRTAADPVSIVGPVREAVAALDPDLPLYNIRNLDEIVEASVAQPRFNSLLLGLFAGLAVLLAAIGVYGLISVAVSQRLREIGVRLALGADRGTILAMVFRQGMLPVLAGAVLGVGVALAGARVLASLVHGVSTRDPLTYVVVTCLLLVVAAVACFVPALRATRVDPIDVLREE